MVSARPEVTAFLHEPSSTISYLIADRASGVAAVVDPAADFDLATGRLRHDMAERMLRVIDVAQLSVHWILETHIHADHVSAAQFLKARCGGQVATGRRITEVQEFFAGIYDEDAEFARDGSQFDRLFDDDATFPLGSMTVCVMATPGHTPACVSYLVGDAIFVGDSIFMPDSGTARCDFPGGSAARLYRSARRILSLDAATRVFVGHDYGGEGRAIGWESSVGAQKRENRHVRDGVSLEEFVALRSTRDAQLGLPRLIIPAIQINMRAGLLPVRAGNGRSYLKIPVNGYPGAF